MQRFDRYWIGITLGLLLPLLFCVVYIDNFHLWNAIRQLGNAIYPTMSKLLLLSVFPNMALVFVFYTTDTWRLSKGVLIGAMPYMIGATLLTI